MRIPTAGTFGLVVCFWTCMALAKSPAIYFNGASIGIGMNLAAATAQLDSNGYVLGDSATAGTYIIYHKYKPDDPAGQLSVKNGVITAVVRDWTPSNRESASAFADAVVSALHTAALKGPAACTLDFVPYEQPGWQSNGVEINCGGRRITISSIKMSGERYGDKPSVSVFEHVESDPAKQSPPN